MGERGRAAPGLPPGAGRLHKKMTVDEYFTTVCPNTRIRNALVREGVKTMAQLCAMTEAQLMLVRNIGQKSFDIIMDERRRFLGEENI